MLLGTVVAGWISIDGAAAMVLCLSALGWLVGRQVPPAPRVGPPLVINYNPFTSSWRLITATLHIPRLFLAICAISFFWTIGAVLIIIFPPLVKNVLTADERVASAAIAIFSVGVAIGSVVINTMLKGRISARYFARLGGGDGRVRGAVLTGGAPLVGGAGGPLLQPVRIRRASRARPGHAGAARHRGDRRHVRGAALRLPHTTVEKDQTARTVAANNVVNAGAMTLGSIAVLGITAMGVTPQNMLFLVAGMCLVSAWLAQKLHRACD